MLWKYLVLCLLLFAPTSTLGQVKVIAAYPDTLAAGQTPKEFHVQFITMQNIDVTVAPTIDIVSTAPSGAVSQYSAFNSQVAAKTVQISYIALPTLALSSTAACTTASTASIATGGVRITWAIACGQITAYQLIHFIIPFDFLNANPTEYTSFTTSVTVTATATQTGTANVPYTISVPERYLNSLQYLKLQPSTTIADTALTSLTATFVPGKPLHAGDYVALWIEKWNILQVPTVFPTVTVGGCTASGVSVAITNGYGTTGAGSYAKITLGPAGCELPQGYPVTFTLGSPYLNKNPAVAANADVSSMLYTNVEPVPLGMQFPHDYSFGLTSITSFNGALPSTTVAGALPSTLAVSFTTSKQLVAASIVYISSIKGVFKPDVQNIPITFLTGSTCAGTTGVLGSTSKAGILSFTVGTTCAGLVTAAVSSFNIQVTSLALVPNMPAGTTTYWDVVTTLDQASINWAPSYVTTAGSLASGSYTNTDVYSTALRSTSLVNFMLLMSPYAWGTLTNGNTTYYKIPQAAWPVSPASYSSLLIRNWGYMATVPMLAVLTTYPLTVDALTSLQVPKTICGDSALAFLFSVDRFTTSGLPSNVGNPIDFNILAASAVSKVIVLNSANGVGQTLERGWAQGSNNNVYVDSPNSGVFVGCSSGSSSQGIFGSDSDDAWLGFLAFLILPVCCCICCCIAALLFFKKWRSKKQCENPCCPMEQCCPAGPEYMLPMAACAPTPVFGF